MSVRILALLVVASGCGRIGFDPTAGNGDGGGDDGDGGTFVSGTRLKLMSYEFAEGTGTYAGLFDSLLGAQCQPMKTTEGLTRCVPADSIGLAGFADASCTQPVGAVLLACPNEPPPYFLEADFSTCEATETVKRVFRRGAAMGTGVFYLDDGTGGCFGPLGMFERFALDVEVTLAELVPLTETEPAIGERITTVDLIADDGLVAPGDLHDNMLASRCGPNTFGSTTVCAPRDATTAIYADAQCAMPIGRTEGCAPPAYLQVTELPQCPDSRQHWYARGPMIGMPPTLHSWNGGCSTLSTGPSEFWALGPEVAVAELTRAPKPTSARLHHVYASVGSTQWDELVLWDTELAAECRPERTATGAACVPFGPGIVSYFTDATCTTQLEVVQVPDVAGCTLVPPAFAVRRDQCARATEVRTVGARYSGPIYLNSGPCALYTNSEARFLLGSAVTNLATAAVTIAP